MNQPESNEDKEKLREGFYTLSAIDYRDGGKWDVLLSDQHVRKSRNYGMELASELAHIVPWVLLNPTAIFMGIRWETDEENTSDALSWLCYVGVPENSFDRHGKKTEPFENRLYLVFVNADRIVYHYRWERCSPDNPRLPIGHDNAERPRFRKRVL